MTDDTLPEFTATASAIAVFSTPDDTALDELTVTMVLSDGKRVDLPETMYCYNDDGNLKVQVERELSDLYEANEATLEVAVDD